MALELAYIINEGGLFFFFFSCLTLSQNVTRLWFYVSDKRLEAVNVKLQMWLLLSFVVPFHSTSRGRKTLLYTQATESTLIVLKYGTTKHNINDSLLKHMQFSEYKHQFSN